MTAEYDENTSTDTDSGYGASGADTGDLAIEESYAFRRVASLSTELEDISEVEYRQLRLEQVVLVGVWSEGTLRGAENSLADLSLLAWTAGSSCLRAVV